MDYVKGFDTGIQNLLGQYMKKQSIVKGVIHLLLVLYSARVAPDLPPQITDLFKNVYFKLFVFSLILWTAQFSPSTSILIALAFMVTVNYINNKPLWELLENVDGSMDSKEVAVNTAANAVMSQSVVAGVAQSPETIVVQPKIVETEQGPTVVNPTVVLAPMVVSSPDGNQMVIKPDVTVLQTAQPEQPQMQPQEAPMPAPASAPEAAPAPPKSPEDVVEKPESGCYPIRQYDMSKISAFGNEIEYGSL